MGGRAAEELVNGRGNATMGAQNDIQEATDLAVRMVTVGGLSEDVGPRSLQVGVPPSQALRSKADEEVNKLLRTALAGARDALSRNRALLDAVVEKLRQQETLDAEAFQRLVEAYPVEPAML